MWLYIIRWLASYAFHRGAKGLASLVFDWLTERMFAVWRRLCETAEKAESFVRGMFK